MKKIIVNVTLISLLFSACKIKNLPENLGVITNPTVALPLIDLNLTLRDVVNSQDIQPTVSERADGLYTLSYKDTLKPIFVVSDYIKLLDQSFSKSFVMPAADVTIFNLAPSGFNRIFSNSGEIDFNVTQDQLLTKATLKSGAVSITTTSSFPENVQVTMDFPDVVNAQNTKLSTSFLITKGSGPVTTTINMAGYELDLTRGSTPENKLRYNINYSVNKPSGSASTITSANNIITFNGSITNLNYSYLEGYLGEIALDPILDSVVVELFRNSIEGDIEFSEPVVSIGIDNSAGISANLKIEPLNVSFSKRNTQTVITRNNSNTFLDTTITGPLVTAPNTTVTTNVNWTAQNSNIQTAFKPSPFTVKYRANVVLNQKSTIAKNTKNFITDKSTVRVRASVDLPLVGSISKLTITDTTKLDVQTDFQKSYPIEYIKYKLNTTNGFPIDCQLQAYFLDSTKAITDSVVDVKDLVIMPAATVDANGKTISMGVKYYERSFTKAQYDKNIKNARYMLMVGKFNTFKNASGIPQKIKIFADNKIRVKLSGEAKVNINASTKQ